MGLWGGRDGNLGLRGSPGVSFTYRGGSGCPAGLGGGCVMPPLPQTLGSVRPCVPVRLSVCAHPARPHGLPEGGLEGCVCVGASPGPFLNQVFINSRAMENTILNKIVMGASGGVAMFGIRVVGPSGSFLGGTQNRGGGTAPQCSSPITARAALCPHTKVPPSTERMPQAMRAALRGHEFLGDLVGHSPLHAGRVSVGSSVMLLGLGDPFQPLWQ